MAFNEETFDSDICIATYTKGASSLVKRLKFVTLLCPFRHLRRPPDHDYFQDIHTATSCDGDFYHEVCLI
jgi:hypothetical protein